MEMDVTCLGCIELRSIAFEVAGMTPAPAAPILPNLSTSPTTVQRLDITLSDGRRILVEGATALSAVLAMVEGPAQ